MHQVAQLFGRGHAADEMLFHKGHPGANGAAKDQRKGQHQPGARKAGGNRHQRRRHHAAVGHLHTGLDLQVADPRQQGLILGARNRRFLLQPVDFRQDVGGYLSAQQLGTQQGAGVLGLAVQRTHLAAQHPKGRVRAVALPCVQLRQFGLQIDGPCRCAFRLAQIAFQLFALTLQFGKRLVAKACVQLGPVAGLQGSACRLCLHLCRQPPRLDPVQFCAQGGYVDAAAVTLDPPEICVDEAFQPLV